MHPKTIQRYIREGKLRASKVGKSWRVSGHDLSVFTENIGLTGQATLESAQDRINISCVVDILTDRTDEGIGIVNPLTAARKIWEVYYAYAVFGTRKQSSRCSVGTTSIYAGNVGSHCRRNGKF